MKTSAIENQGAEPLFLSLYRFFCWLFLPLLAERFFSYLRKFAVFTPAFPEDLLSSKFLNLPPNISIIFRFIMPIFQPFQPMLSMRLLNPEASMEHMAKLLEQNTQDLFQFVYANYALGFNDLVNKHRLNYFIDLVKSNLTRSTPLML